MIGPYQKIRTDQFRANETASADAQSRAFADWLAAALRDHGERVRAVVSKDFGWCLMLRAEPFNTRIECGSRNAGQSEWGAYAVAEPPLLTRIFRMAEARGEVERLTGLLQRVLAAVPGQPE